MGDITLTASIRSNLLSLQNTTRLLDLTSERLSTGLRVNSALDNASAFFSARSLDDRAQDLASRQDSIGQAISLLEATDVSINSLIDLVEQAEATAQSAKDSSSSGVSLISSSTAQRTGTFTISSEAVTAAAANDTSTLTTLAANAAAANDTATVFTDNIDAGASVGSTLTAAFGTAGVSNGDGFTVNFDGATSVALAGTSTVAQFVSIANALNGVTASFNTTTQRVDITAAGGGQLTFVDDSSNGAVGAGLFERDDNNQIANNTAVTFTSNGNASDVFTAAFASSVGDILTIDITGTDGATDGQLAFTIDAGTTVNDFITEFNAVDANVQASFNTTSRQISFTAPGGAAITFTDNAGDAIAVGDLQIVNDGGTTVTSATGVTFDTNGNASDLARTAFGLTAGDILSLDFNSGTATRTITIQNQTVSELATAISQIDSSVSASFNTTSGKLEIVATGGNTLTFTNSANDTPIADLGLSNDGGTTTITSGAAEVFVDSSLSITATDLLVNVLNVNAAETFTTTVDGGGTNTFTVSASSTIQDLLDNINAADSSLSATFNTSTNKIEINAPATTSVQFSGTGFAGLTLNDGTNNLTASTDVTYGSAGNTSQVTSLNTDFQTILEQIETLLGDSSYAGTNLLQGSNTLDVLFNADGTSFLTLNGVDLGVDSNTNLSFSKDSDGYNFATAGDIDTALSDAADAIEVLRNLGSSFGASLGIIQTREAFTERLITELEVGADRLVNANIEEESANLLALQTRQSLGIQALSISNQSNQSVLQLFR